MKKLVATVLLLALLSSASGLANGYDLILRTGATGSLSAYPSWSPISYSWYTVNGGEYISIVKGAASANCTVKGVSAGEALIGCRIDTRFYHAIYGWMYDVEIYYYKILVTNEIVTPAPTPAPTPTPPPSIYDGFPTLWAERNGDGSVCFKWTEIIGAEYYQILRGDSPDDMNEFAAKLTGTSQIIDVDSNDNGYYRVRGYMQKPNPENADIRIYSYWSDAVQITPYAAPTPTAAPVKVKPKSVKLNMEGTVKLNIDSTLQLTVKFKPSTATSALKWSSSDKKTAKVDSSGMVTPVKEGTVTITVKTANGKKDTVKIKVVNPYKPKKVALEETGTVKVRLGEKLQLHAILTPGDARTALKWSSSDRKCAKVDGSGVVTPVKKGTATITVTTANGKKAAVKVKVIKKEAPLTRRID